MKTATLLTLLLVATPTLAQTIDGPVPTSLSDSGRPGGARPGWTLALDVGGEVFSLDDEVATRLGELDLELGDAANGGGLSVGYSWSNQFALEAHVFGGQVSTGNTEIDGGLGHFLIAARAPLLPQSRIAPYLEGHLGGTVLYFEGEPIEDRAFLGTNTGIGGGVEVHVHRRWALDFGYRFSLVDFQKEAFESSDGDAEVDIEGTGRVHHFTLRTVFSF